MLDDPLSALDPPTAVHVWRAVVLGLLAHATRVVATNRWELCNDADAVIVLSGGVALDDHAADQERQRLTQTVQLVDAVASLAEEVEV